MAEKKLNKEAFFITVEGLEGSGKTSVIAFLDTFLKAKGYRVKVFREPGSTEVGEKIREILLDKKNRKLSGHTELLLYLAARTQLIEEKLNLALEKYDFVVCDRFFDSTIIYQGVGCGLGRIVDDAVALFSLGLEPDLTVFLDAPVETGLSRIKDKDRIESRPLTFHKKLRKGYLSLAEKYPQRIKVVDAFGSLEEIYSQVQTVVEKKFFK
ncbi:MAG: dTMP kinase [Candidatus Omnitrophica bacterium]|nr:dTMP kinase [Candidatus Omnitrophota bacterium]